MFTSRSAAHRRPSATPTVPPAPRRGTSACRPTQDRPVGRWTIALAALLTPALAAGLTACDGVVTYRSEAAGNPSAQTYAPYAAMNGTNLLVVRNNPFPNDPGNKAILEVVNTHNPMLKYRFALTPPPDWNGYTVVLGFGEAPVGNVSLCQNARLPLQGRMAAIADLCLGPQLVTEVYGHSPPIAATDDPRLGHLIGQIMTELFQPRVIYEDRPRSSPFFRF